MEAPRTIILVVGGEVPIPLSEVIHAASGEKAVQIVQGATERIDLVLMDLRPGKGMTGAQAARAILGTHDIPILFLYTPTDLDLIQGTLEVTNYGYVLKSSPFVVLDASIKSALNRHKEKKHAEAELHEKALHLKIISDNVPASVAILDANSLRYTYVNNTYESLYKLSNDQFLGMKLRDLAGETNYQNLLPYLHEALQGRKSTYDREFTVPRGTIWGQMDYAPQLDDHGKVEHVLIMGFDITERVRMAEALRKSEDRFRLAMEATTDSLWDSDLVRNEVYYSPAFYTLLDYTPEETFVLKDWEQFLDPSSRELLDAAILDCAEDRKPGFDIDCRIQTRDGSWKWINTRGKIVGRDREGKATRIVGTSRDISERKRNEERISTLAEDLRTILDTAPIGIVKILGRRFLWANKACATVFGCEEAALLRMDVAEFFPASGAWETFYSTALETFARGEMFSCFQEIVRHGGSRSTLHFFGKPIDASDLKQGIIFAGEDVTELKKIEETLKASEAKYRALSHQLFELSNTDQLTSAANRRHFDTVFANEWKRAVRNKGRLSLIMGDVDLFKQFNDSYGHQAGDDCLKSVAQALRKTMKRETDLVARYGGEEFVVVLPFTDMKQAEHLAGCINEAVRALKIPHGQSPFGIVTISLGVSSAVPDRDMEPASLVSAADQALYKAKAGGRNRFAAQPE